MAASQSFTLVAGTLAVWRLTHLLWNEDGPADVFVRLRRLAGDGFFGRLVDCFYCSSLWIAAPFAWALAEQWRERFVFWLALSAGAILLERVTAARAVALSPADWDEDLTAGDHHKEVGHDGLLR
jgi:hypothetical protein